MPSKPSDLAANVQSMGRELADERNARNAELAILRARLDAAGVPDLSDDEKAAIRLSFKAGPPSPSPETPPTVVGPKPRRSGRGART